MSSERKQASGLSPTKLAITSASSVAAAIVVSRLWGPGTLIGAAATPVIIALVSEGLHRPARAVSTVRESRTARFDPVAEGRRGMREGDLERARPARGGEAAPGARRQPRARPPSSRTAAILRRRRLVVAVATGLVAFVIGGVVLTGTELVFGESAVSGASKRTTYFGGGSSKSDSKTTTTTDEETRPTTTTQTTTETETQPGIVPTTGTETLPPGTTTTQPGVAPPTTASPGGTPAPTTTAPPPATTP